MECARTVTAEQTPPLNERSGSVSDWDRQCVPRHFLPSATTSPIRSLGSEALTPSAQPWASERHFDDFEDFDSSARQHVRTTSAPCCPRSHGQTRQTSHPNLCQGPRMRQFATSRRRDQRFRRNPTGTKAQLFVKRWVTVPLRWPAIGRRARCLADGRSQIATIVDTRAGCATASRRRPCLLSRVIPRDTNNACALGFGSSEECALLLCLWVVRTQASAGLRAPHVLLPTRDISTASDASIGAWGRTSDRRSLILCGCDPRGTTVQPKVLSCNSCAVKMENMQKTRSLQSEQKKELQ